MAIFIYQPKVGLANLTCDQGEDLTNAYQVLPSSIDMNEQARLEIVYAEGKIGGTVRGTKAGLVPIKHQILVKGTSPENVESNARTLKQTLAAADGGYLQYRPLGWDSAMSTYYHYLQSKPPKVVVRGLLSDTRIKRYHQVHDETYTDGILYEVELMTEAWATSDPETIISILGATVISNHDDAGHDNYVTVPSSSLKGDALIPIVQVIGTSSYSLILHHRSMRVGANSNLDWFEAEDFDTRSNFATQNDPGNVSNDDYERCSSATGYLFWQVSSSMDTTYLGKITPLACIRLAAGTTYNARFIVRYTAYTQAVGEYIEIVGDGNWRIEHTFGELDFPPLTPQSFIDDGSTPAIGVYLTDMLIQLQFERVTGSGNLDVDFVLVPKSDEWIAKLEGQGKIFDLAFSRYFQIDATSDGSYIRDSSLNDKLLDIGYKYGTPVKDLVMLKGWDHRLRFLSDLDTFVIGDSMTVRVYGLHATVYPFEEA